MSQVYDLHSLPPSSLWSVHIVLFGSPVYFYPPLVEWMGNTMDSLHWHWQPVLLLSTHYCVILIYTYSLAIPYSPMNVNANINALLAN